MSGKELSTRSYLVNADFKTTMKFINESYSCELKFFTSMYNKLKEKQRFEIGIIFYNSLIDQPRKKAMYFSFVERQEDPDPKNYKNALRFLNEMAIKTEFQAG